VRRFPLLRGLDAFFPLNYSKTLILFSVVSIPEIALHSPPAVAYILPQSKTVILFRQAHWQNFWGFNSLRFESKPGKGLSFCRNFGKLSPIFFFFWGPVFVRGTYANNVQERLSSFKNIDLSFCEVSHEDLLPPFFPLPASLSTVMHVPFSFL